MKRHEIETDKDKRARLLRQLSHMGDCADHYARDFGEDGARALTQEKFAQLARLTKKK